MCWTTDSSERKRSELERLVGQEKIRVINKHNLINFLVAMRPWETPVPIPNTMVKTWTADGTLLETVRESRWLPVLWAYSSAG